MLSHSIPRVKAAISRHFAVLGLLLLAFAGYFLFASHAPPAKTQWLFDWVDTFQLLSIDDAYRYFAARGAWVNGALWHWYYVLPGNLLFDGVLAKIFQDAMLPMRVGHILLTLTGVFFVYLCCLQLQVRKWIASLVTFALLAMPLFAIIGMSFYGESLLTPLLSVAYYCHLKGYRYRFVLLASMAPLVHPDGLAFILPFFVWYAWRRDWKIFFLLALPGFLYFLNILCHESLIEYLSILQLHKLYPALPLEAQRRHWWDSLVLLNPVFCLLAVAGGLLFCKKGSRSEVFLPVFASALLWLLLDCFVLAPINSYEPRYVVACLPGLMIGYALFWEVSCRVMQRYGHHLSALLAIGVVLLLALENLGQSDPIRNLFMGDRRWPLSGSVSKGVDRFYVVMSYTRQYGEDMADRITNFLHRHDQVKLVMVSDFNLLYFLDPVKLPPATRVCYTPFEAKDVYYSFGGKYFCMSAKSPQVAFYQFYSSKGNDTRAVVVGDFSSLGWKPAYNNPLFTVYEASYVMTPPPERMQVLYRLKDVKRELPSAWGNLCPDHMDYICPDWRILGFDYRPDMQASGTESYAR